MDIPTRTGLLLYGNNKYEILEFVLAIPLSTVKLRMQVFLDQLIKHGNLCFFSIPAMCYNAFDTNILECRCGAVFNSHYVIFSRV